MLWRIVRRELPECKIVLVRRPLIEVHKSLARAGAVTDLSALAEVDAMLDAAATDPAINSIHYDQLSDPMIGKLLFEYCLELEWDFEWWSRLVQVNVQVDMPKWLDQKDLLSGTFKSLVSDVKIRSKSLSLLN